MCANFTNSNDKFLKNIDLFVYINYIREITFPIISTIVDKFFSPRFILEITFPIISTIVDMTVF